MTANLIQNAFAEMVSSISKIVTSATIPHLYHPSATTHETNSVYHFAKAVEQQVPRSAVYLEYQCDSGRVDAVIVTPSAWLLVEAKSRLDFGKLGSLEDQAARLENSSDSLRKYLAARIPPFKRAIWNLAGQDEIWGVLIAETVELRWLKFWRSLPTNASYPTLRTYRSLDRRNPVYTAQVWYHLLAFKRIA